LRTHIIWARTASYFLFGLLVTLAPGYYQSSADGCSNVWSFGLRSYGLGSTGSANGLQEQQVGRGPGALSGQNRSLPSSITKRMQLQYDFISPPRLICKELSGDANGVRCF